jgi:unsaturated chondroitin disaccharide hydrolase
VNDLKPSCPVSRVAPSASTSRRRPSSLSAGSRGRVVLVSLAVLAIALPSGCGAGARSAAHASARPPSGTQTSATPPACLSRAPSDTQISHALDVAAARLNADTRTLRPGQFPSITDRAGHWRLSRGIGWTSGFFPGSLWLIEHSRRRPSLLAAARAWTAALAPRAAVTTSHDIGFVIFTSFGNGYRVTHDDAYRRVILQAAASLATRYDPAVGAVRSWGSRRNHAHFLVIIDGLMNLQLLFWAAQHGGSSDWTQLATRDALTVREHFIRPDGSVVHLVDFNPRTGALQGKANPQGYDRASTWARGQAWAVAGFTIAYEETHDPRFLDAARRTATYFLGHLPRNCVPYWDVQAPGIPNAPRDSSAAAIAADGLLSLSRLDPDHTRRRAERRAAGGLLAALLTHDLARHGRALLAHGTPNKPGGESDTGTSYGDYYFLDALQRYRAALRG